jgi:hypothetical protein
VTSSTRACPSPIRQGGPDVADLADADIKQRMGMAQWNFGFLLGLTVSADRLENQHASVLSKTHPGGAVPLLGKEALDVAQSTPLTPDQAGEGRGEEKAAANSHGTPAR